MRAFSLAATVIAMAGVLCAGGQTQGRQTPPAQSPALFRSGVRTVAIYATVGDSAGRLVPDLTIDRLDGVGHFAPWEAPDKVTGAMRNWLSARGA